MVKAHASNNQQNAILDKNLSKAKRAVLICNAILAASWPTGMIVGKLCSEGTDPAGKAYVEIFVLTAILALTYIPISIVFFQIGRKHWLRIGAIYKMLLLTPALVLLIPLSMAVYIALD